MLISFGITSCSDKKEESSKKETSEKSPETEKPEEKFPEPLAKEELSEKTKLKEEEIAGLTDKSEVFRYTSDYNLTEIPSVVFECKYLQTIELNNFQGTSLPESIKELKNLQVLYLSGATQLTEIPEFIAEMPHLKTIAITAAAKIDLQQAFNVLMKSKTIENVQITNSKVSSALPANLNKMEQLKTLDISNNIIPTFTVGFYGLPSLETLSISSDKENPYNYDQIFKNLMGLKKLERLSVYYSGIKDFPEEIKKCTSLTQINWREEGPGWDNTDAITKTKEKIQVKFPNISFPLAPYESLFYDLY
jgi:Leucine-rich repeat (LRR) protein